jgi:hypothetical protein
MGGACITHGRDKKYIENVWWGNLKGGGYLEDLYADVRIILK